MTQAAPRVTVASFDETARLPANAGAETPVIVKYHAAANVSDAPPAGAIETAKVIVRPMRVARIATVIAPDVVVTPDRV